jgi:2-(1,2-epoxy-1,2-dihydrophenyl)acetyl-CoA isomerase
MALHTIDTGTSDLLAHIDDGVAVITMNRPERRNALSAAMLAALADTLAACETNAGVGAVVLTGAGVAFCAGGDVKGMAEAHDCRLTGAMQQAAVDAAG